MKCPGSVHISRPDTDERDEEQEAKDKPWLAEGTLAHAVCEALLMDEPLPEGATQEMIDHAEDFYDYVMSLGPDMVYIEQRLEHPVHSEFGGTPDVIITRTVGGVTQLHCIDYKYGKGLAVKASGNYQLRGYLVLAMREYGEFDEYVGHIFQPRLGGFSLDTWTPEDIIDFEQQLSVAMTQTQLVPGSHCRWCPALATCTAVRANAMQAAAKTFGNDPASPEDWQFLLDNKEAIKALLDEAPKQVLNYMKQGVEFKGYKAVATFGRKTWDDEEAAMEQLTRDYDDVTVTKLRTPTQLIKEGVPEEEIDELASKPHRGYAVVKESDRRPSEDVRDTHGFTEI